jgi:hypothetical protein
VPGDARGGYAVEVTFDTGPWRGKLTAERAIPVP